MTLPQALFAIFATGFAFGFVFGWMFNDAVREVNMARLTLRQRLERCKSEIERARKHHRKSEPAYREAVDVMKRILRRENAQVRRAAQ